MILCGSQASCSSHSGLRFSARLWADFLFKGQIRSDFRFLSVGVLETGNDLRCVPVELMPADEATPQALLPTLSFISEMPVTVPFHPSHDSRVRMFPSLLLISFEALNSSSPSEVREQPVPPGLSSAAFHPLHSPSTFPEC